MTISGIRILPPMAIGRMGSADEPLDNYVVTVKEGAGALDFRAIHTAETLVVDKVSGEIVKVKPASPNPPQFKSGRQIRPVAPFLELFVDNDDGQAVALTVDMLDKAKLSVRWRAEVGNFKMFRRTGDVNDQVHADTGHFHDHKRHALHGHCVNFVKGKSVPLGWVQFIKPNAKHPEIRLRFTPAAGLIYGSTPVEPPIVVPRPDGIGETSDIYIPPEHQVYDSQRGSWHGYTDSNELLNTLGQGLYASYGATPYFNYYDEPQPSRGYLDDVCDGIVTAELVDKHGHVKFTARARICAAPPIFAPDSGFVRTIADDLKQVISGPEITDEEVTPAEAADIVRRAYDTLRFMHTPSLNNVTYNEGQPGIPDTMPVNDHEDYDRASQPVFGPHGIDTVQVLSYHRFAYDAVAQGAGTAYENLLRQPGQTGDMTDEGRGRMPALMSGADARYLALTRRQANSILNAKVPADGAAAAPGLTPRNLTAQMTYLGQGNPPNTGVASAVGNCCPGLEFDFRSVWRRTFVGITLVEHTNYVVQADPGFEHLLNHRLLKVGDVDVAIPVTGPKTVDGPTESLGAMSMEWSNALAFVWQQDEIVCTFTKEATQDDVLPGTTPQITQIMKVRKFFEPGTAVISPELAIPGEMTQGLCSPWQNDFRECVCYYWASSRPDYVNMEVINDTTSTGDNWLQKERTGVYVVDDYLDKRLITYKDLFEDWEGMLKFQIGGKDVPE